MAGTSLNDMPSATACGCMGTSALLAGLLPRGIEVSELFADPPDVTSSLYPEEVDLVARAVEKRRREFAAVRMCARTAMARLGVPSAPSLPGEHRSPVWPDGIVGSMTHCDGYRAAAVARRSVVISIGVDAEPHDPLPDGVEEAVLLSEERDAALRLSERRPDTAWDRLIFSAKESVFKAWFPMTAQWLDFSECVVAPDPDRGTFTATLLVPGPVVAGERIQHFTGRWRTRGGIEQGHVATAVLVGIVDPSRAGRDPDPPLVRAAGKSHRQRGKRST
ncbi:4'-phosphopantetheinyl transferase [Streptomyces diastaticus]|uniref:4'-phosphopantetheinyl transferase n=2 Tax=Streptomyces TaxID=1883 RepID=A0ABQ1CSI0_STRDI|nr:4'-phosphopantetheinyl transferase superfamily protein [Streptomyces diastaticus]WTD07121.1 4'-phosphopantetheinyl transferase superfamily protein [Streptomyces albidoflavus]GFH73232.1 4'-phosphopantetheinyl transferase [Streptomyces diastaticus subsp. diastaticus]GGU46071.1 4'-phosphopantetheinyl transferase [Streptomyces diastaticus subsp. diastaticus]